MLSIGDDSAEDEIASFGDSEELHCDYTKGSWRRKILSLGSHFIYEKGRLDIRKR
jgi:hypothetical protein